MRNSIRMFVVFFLGLLIAGLICGNSAVNAEEKFPLKTAREMFTQANFRDALIPLAEARQQSEPLSLAEIRETAELTLRCYLSLNEPDNAESALREIAEKFPSRNECWRYLFAAAESFRGLPHRGSIFANQFTRRNDRRGEAVSTFLRDRAQVLQWLTSASSALTAENASATAAEKFAFYEFFADCWQQGGEPWRLQLLTNIAELPDYDAEYAASFGFYPRRRELPGAPVDDDGNPRLYQLPDNFSSAQNDGERWRWCLRQASEFADSANEKARENLELLEFSNAQFGLGTLGFIRLDDAESAAAFFAGALALDTLTDNECVARLASGITRFSLPDDYAPQRLRQKIFADANGDADLRRDMARQIADEYRERRQYEKALAWYELLRANGDAENADEAIAQISGKWAKFEPTNTTRARLVFRNADKIAFSAYRIRVEELLQDTREQISGDVGAGRSSEKSTEINDLARRLVFDGESAYIGEKAAEWEMKLPPSHEKKYAEQTVPVQLPDGLPAGGYLLEGKIPGGNISRIVIWKERIALVQKPLAGKMLYFAADAETGAPIANLAINAWGYRRVWRDKQLGIKFKERTLEKTTDINGCVLFDEKELRCEGEAFTWLITAKDKDVFAYHGFVGMWVAPNNASSANFQSRERSFIITDRPIYRLGDSVKIKVWTRLADYSQALDAVANVGDTTIEIIQPNGESAAQTSAKRDEFGGGEFTWEIPADAPLGLWRIVDKENHSVRTFRVEEYRKPEFTVEVVKPKSLVALGDKFSLKIKAQYYYGQPVKNASIHYTITRDPVASEWFPLNRWDWLYGRGFGRFTTNAIYQDGATAKIAPPFWHRPPAPVGASELVAEQTGELDANGEISLLIDTSSAKTLYPNLDHRYNVKAEVTDASRRIIDGAGSVTVAKKPFTVTAWSDCGFYDMPAKITVRFHAQTVSGQPAIGSGVMKISRLTYAKGEKRPQEKIVKEISLSQNEDGDAEYVFIPDEPGQYLAAYTLTTNSANTITKSEPITGATIINVRGDEKFTGKFSPLEIVLERATYSVGERCRLQINTDNPMPTVLWFVRGKDGVNQPPKMLNFTNHGGVAELTISDQDQPNIFVEAITVWQGKVYNEVKQIAVPPQARILNVEITPTKTRLAPGEKTELTLRLTERNGKPYRGQATVAIYDRSIEYISGGSNIPEIKKFFWNWTRTHHGGFTTNCGRYSYNALKKNETAMQTLSHFEQFIRDLPTRQNSVRDTQEMNFAAATNAAPMMMKSSRALAMSDGAVAAVENKSIVMDESSPNTNANADGDSDNSDDDSAASAVPMVRENFADTAYWNADIRTDSNGEAKITFVISESLTAWKVRTWAMGSGTAVGEGECELVTFKNYLLRLQTPKFLTVGDLATISANVHNYGDREVSAKTSLGIAGEGLQRSSDNAAQSSKIAADGETRVDWQVAATAEGKAEITAQTIANDGRSDAMRLTVPINVHGIEQTVSVSGALRPEQVAQNFSLNVPEKRRLDSTQFNLQFSPSIAPAMLDALPYLLEYPYGCTEQTLNRFLPLVIAQGTLKKLGFSLAEIKNKQVNFNAQELGDAAVRAKQWQKNRVNYYDPTSDKMLPFAPVFDEETVTKMVEYGIKRLTAMQCSDGGWGWFSGTGEQSYPHTTALVVRGLLTARANGAIIPGKIIDAGVNWLRRYQQREIAKLTADEQWRETKAEIPNSTAQNRKPETDNLDALLYTTLAQASDSTTVANSATQRAILKFLTRDRAKLSPYGKALFGIGLVYEIAAEKNRSSDLSATPSPDLTEPLTEVLRNLAQFVVIDNENQTARLELGADNCWWRWYGSPIETQAAYLKLLALSDPQNPVAAQLAKFLLNQRKNSARWTSTRDTSFAVEALADFVANGEDLPTDATVEISLDGKLLRREKITRENLFTFDNRIILRGNEIGTGNHRVEVRRKGDGAVYYNAYLSYFSSADYIRAAGLEVKVARKIYRLISEETPTETVGARGQAVAQAGQKYRREELKNGDTIHSGDLLETELSLSSKNDYEYLLFRDHQLAGAEPVAKQSGYAGVNFSPYPRERFSPDIAAERDAESSLPSYIEYRLDTVNVFIRELPRGENTVKYRSRAIYPGVFSALPTEVEAMYAPELRANSDEIKLRIDD